MLHFMALGKAERHLQVIKVRGSNATATGTTSGKDT